MLKMPAFAKRIQDSFRRWYLQGYQDGKHRRNHLIHEELPLETMSTNQYRGETFHGLYGYMDGMEGKPSRFLDGDLVECSFCGAEFIREGTAATICDPCRPL